jgi:spore coat protein U-like protein
MSSHAVLESCEVSATDLVFGVYDPLQAAPHDGAGIVTVRCTVTLLAVLASWEVLLSTGNSGTYAARALTSGGNTLFYNLYTTAARTTVWGNGAGGSGKVGASSTLLPTGTSTYNYNLYGRIPVAQDRPAGTYTDSIVVTLNY